MNHLLIEQLLRAFHADPERDIPVLPGPPAYQDACIYAQECSKLGFTIEQVLDTALDYIAKQAIKRWEAHVKSQEHKPEPPPCEPAPSLPYDQYQDSPWSFKEEKKRRKYSDGCSLKAYRRMLPDDDFENREKWFSAPPSRYLVSSVSIWAT